MLKKIFAITFLAIIIWGSLLSEIAASGLLKSRLRNLEFDFNRLESQVNRIERQLNRGNYSSPKTPNNAPSSPRRSRRVSPQEREEMFDRLATLVIEIKDDIKDLQKRVSQLENK